MFSCLLPRSHSTAWLQFMACNLKCREIMKLEKCGLQVDYRFGFISFLNTYKCAIYLIYFFTFFIETTIVNGCYFSFFGSIFIILFCWHNDWLTWYDLRLDIDLVVNYCHQGGFWGSNLLPLWKNFFNLLRNKNVKPPPSLLKNFRSYKIIWKLSLKKFFWIRPWLTCYLWYYIWYVDEWRLELYWLNNELIILLVGN